MKAVLGHSPNGDVTLGYITVTLEDQLATVKRAALLIDGEPKSNVVPIMKQRARASA